MDDLYCIIKSDKEFDLAVKRFELLGYDCSLYNLENGVVDRKVRYNEYVLFTECDKLNGWWDPLGLSNITRPKEKYVEGVMNTIRWSKQLILKKYNKKLKIIENE